MRPAVPAEKVAAIVNRARASYSTASRLALEFEVSRNTVLRYCGEAHVALKPGGSNGLGGFYGPADWVRDLARLAQLDDPPSRDRLHLARGIDEFRRLLETPSDRRPFRRAFASPPPQVVGSMFGGRTDSHEDAA